jgi:hypothetical protein
MKIKNIILSGLIILLASGCGVPEEDYNKLKSNYNKSMSENKKLIKDLDECKNGADKIIGRIEKAKKEKNYVMAINNINQLYKRFPEASENTKYQKSLKILEKKNKAVVRLKAKKELAEKKKRAKKKLADKKKRDAKLKEQRRIANLNNTGIWSVNFYVDDFGEPTKQGYITNTSDIRGTFSNTATQDSKLNVRFLISKSNDISIKLFEYAGNNPVKGYSDNKYRVVMQDKNGKRYKLNATNYSDRLSFGSSDSTLIHKALLKGGSIKFRITETRTPTTQYSFKIGNTEWYNNAYRKLKGK